MHFFCIPLWSFFFVINVDNWYNCWYKVGPRLLSRYLILIHDISMVSVPVLVVHLKIGISFCYNNKWLNIFRWLNIYLKVGLWNLFIENCFSQMTITDDLTMHKSHLIFADYTISENWTQNADCSICCMAYSAVLLKPNAVLCFDFVKEPIG